MTFEQPLWLLLMLLAIPAAVIGLRWFTTMSPLRRWTAVVARSALIALVSLMLAGAAAVQTSDRVAVIAVIDVSDSVRDFADAFADFEPDASGRRARWDTAIAKWITDATAERGPDDLFGVVVFDGSTIAVATPRGPARRQISSDSTAVTDVPLDFRITQGSDIASALRFASSLFPPDARRRLLLFSDGNQTTGNAIAAAREIAAGPATSSGRPGGTPIDVVPITYAVRNEVMIEAVDAPPQAQRDATITVRVVLTATDPTTGTLDLLYEGRPLDLNADTPGTARRITLPAGRHVELIDIPLSDITIHRLRPIFTPDDPAADRLASNNTAEAVTVTPGQGRVLVVDGVSRAETGGSGAILPDTLRRSGIDTEVLPPQAMPTDLLSLQAYDLVMLQNVAADDVPRQSHQAMADYVQTLGGGLVMIGGPDSFGAGGWKGTALEPVLPVRLDLPEELITPSAAIVIVLDSSGSMAMPVQGSARSQQEIANEGAALAIMTLDKTDMVGVIAFDSDSRVVVPLERNTDAESSARRIRAIAPGGGTNLYPAMTRAGGMLRNVNANLKHIIILSDGRSEGDPLQALAMAEQFADDGITVSTIAVGDAADTTTLAEIAKRGRGQFYPVTDPNLLPRVFIRDIRVVRKPLIREAVFKPVNLRSGSPLMAGIDAATMPPLGGLVLTRPRTEPTVTYALATPEGEPLLAHWAHGRGQVAAFTSDAHRWASRWLDWPGYATLWTTIARTIARPAADRAQELTTEIVDDQLVVRLDATDDQGRPIDALSVRGTVYSPDGSPIQVSLGQVGPGVYEGRVPATQRGNYIVALTPMQGQRALAPVIGGASRALGPEHRRLTSDAALLRELAQITGGRVKDLRRPDTAELFSRDGLPRQRASMPIWRTLLYWTIAVFLLDVATRRLAWDRLLSRELAIEARRYAAEAVAQRAQQAQATVDALRKRADTAADAPAAPRAAPSPAPLQAARPSAPAPAEDAAALARQKAEANAREERQRRIRQQMLSRLSGKDDVDAPPKPPAPKPPATPAPPPPDAATSLREAKRRAQERFGQDQPPKPG